MSTQTIGEDLRRTDLRTNVLETPYWITSGELTFASDTLAAIFFSFPKTASVYSPGYGDSLVLLLDMVLQVKTSFTNDSTTFSIGQGSIATDIITTGGVSTDGTAAGNTPDDYMVEADGDADIIAAAAFNVPDTSSVYLTAKAAGSHGTIASIIPADSTVLCIQGYLTGGTLIAGSAYLHVLISRIPAV